MLLYLSLSGNEWTRSSFFVHIFIFLFQYSLSFSVTEIVVELADLKAFSLNLNASLRWLISNIH